MTRVVRAMANSQAEGVRKALAITSGYGGYCLKFVRICRDVPAKYGTAIAAWNAAKRKHVRNRNVPPGCPAFFSKGNSAGHVIISIGNGKFRSTNSATNKIFTCTIATWEKMGYRYEGWSEDLNGVSVYSGEPVKPSFVIGYGSKGSRVANYQRQMNRIFPAYSRLKVDGSFGPLTRNVTRNFQARAGIKVTGNVDSATMTALARYGVKV